MAFSGMINLKSGLLTLGGQFDAYKRGQLERNIQRLLISSFFPLAFFCFYKQFPATGYKDYFYPLEVTGLTF